MLHSFRNLIIATMLDPRYKNAIFSSGDRSTAYNLVMDELEKIQGAKPTNNNEPPPTKRSKMDENVDFMEAMLDDLDERRKSFEESDLKKIEDASYSLTTR